MSHRSNSDVHICELPAGESLNERIAADFARLQDAPEVRKSHYFAGRYENIYIGVDRIPALAEVYALAETSARAILGLAADTPLRVGGWFNQMGPGQVTLPHRHDDDDELLSAVYYVQVPENAGALVIQEPPFTTRVEPQAGMLVLFPSDVQHEVTENRSQQQRLSIGINIGPGQS